jgi:NAD(P)H-hydrate repair Nnr-like enzyme with NAD(P)H-hydrate dehydratase domain
MATGGMGDLLTGVCAALTGQGLELYEAARVGAWVCGRAAEIARRIRRMSLLRHFGQAFDELRSGSW